MSIQTTKAEQRRKLERHIRDYLKKGGTITKVALGEKTSSKTMTEMKRQHQQKLKLSSLIMN